MFDCLHDMGDPVGAAAHVLETLDADGTWLVVEPYAEDRLEDNLNPVGRVYYGGSTLVCTPASRDARGGPRARGASRRAAAARRGYGWRLHPLPPRRADAIQHRARGAAMICTLTARRLKPESYDAFRTAWDPGRPPDGWTHIYHCRDVADPDVVISFGLFDGSVAGAARGASPDRPPVTGRPYRAPRRAGPARRLLRGRRGAHTLKRAIPRRREPLAAARSHLRRLSPATDRRGGAGGALLIALSSNVQRERDR